jgi:hypothetical protein
MSKKSSNSKTPPNTLNASSIPYIAIYDVPPLNHLISKSSPNFMHTLSPFVNKLIKHKPRKEQDALHEI